jgi:transcriptional regulator of PTS gene
MKDLFTSNYTEITNESRLMQQKLRIIQVISQKGHGITVPEICQELKISAPTGIKLVNELQNEGFLRIVGKKDTINGRKPFIYALSNINFYALGVEILLKRITVGIVDSRLNTIYYRQKTDFILENTPECLKKVEDFIFDCLNKSGVKEDSLLGLGIGITGRVNRETGESVSFFNFMNKSFRNYLSEVFALPVIINNDNRCFGLAEKSVGKARNANYAIVVNLSRMLGTSLIIDNKIVNGENGFAGELAHMQFGSMEKICHCGKKGCLGNEVGGSSLEMKFHERIAAGEKSILSIPKDGSILRYDNILTAALDGDALSINLVQEMGIKLGYALGNIVNLLNPGLIVISGKFAKLKGILLDPVKTGLTSASLMGSLDGCAIEFSELGELGGIKGAGGLVFEKFELIKQ